MTRIARNNCSSQIFQRKEQIIFFEEELSTLKRFFPVTDQFVYFQRFKLVGNVRQQPRSISSRTCLSTQTSAGAQINLIRCELPDEIMTIVKEYSEEKLYFEEK